MEGWPAGWSWDEVEGTARTKRTGAPYIIYGAREGCRRAAWAIEGGEGVAMDREALAMALQAAYRRTFGNDGLLWANIGDSARAGYLAEADEAIRLLVGSKAYKERVFACPSCGPQDRCDEDGCCITHGLDLIEVADEGSAHAVKEACDQLIADHDADRAELRARIEELERANAALTATTNAALERANEAEDEWDEMLTRHTLELTEALGYANGAHFGELLAIVGRRGLALEERDNKIAALTETAKAAAARAEEAQMRAQKAEEAQLHAESDGSTVARVRALGERVQQDQETERLRRALDAMARGVAHMATAVGEMVGGEQP